MDAGAKELDEGRRFPICQPKPLAELFAQAGLTEVAVRLAQTEISVKKEKVTMASYVARRAGVRTRRVGGLGINWPQSGPPNG